MPFRVCASTQMLRLMERDASQGLIRIKLLSKLICLWTPALLFLQCWRTDLTRKALAASLRTQHTSVIRTGTPVMTPTMATDRPLMMYWSSILALAPHAHGHVAAMTKGSCPCTAAHKGAGVP